VAGGSLFPITEVGWTVGIVGAVVRAFEGRSVGGLVGTFDGFFTGAEVVAHFSANKKNAKTNTLDKIIVTIFSLKFFNKIN
jgi:extradiol dioxygenase family protein